MSIHSIFLASFLAASGLAHILNVQPRAYAVGTPLHNQPLAANNVYTKPNTPEGSPGRLTILAYNVYPATGSSCCKCKSSHCASYANKTIWNVDENPKADPQVRLAVGGQPQTVYLNDLGTLSFNNVGQSVPNDTETVTKFGPLSKSGGKTFLGGSWSACPDAHGDYEVDSGGFAGIGGCVAIKILLAHAEVDGKRIGAFSYGPNQLPACCQ